jgi:uncharacterized protein (TIGR02147 family)
VVQSLTKLIKPAFYSLKEREIEMLENAYRQILKEEMIKRCRANRSYSLRAFAKFLDMDSTFLSRVLNGKKNISYSTARRIAKKLFEKEEERHHFVGLAEYAVAKNDSAKEIALENIRNYDNSKEHIQLELDKFRVIAEWYHLPILDAFSLDSLGHDDNSIAKFLGISTFEVKEAKERLVGLGLLKKDGNRYIKTRVKLVVPGGVANVAIQKYHRAMIKKSLDSVVGHSKDDRYLKGHTLALSTDDIQTIKGWIDELNKKAAKLAVQHRKKSREKLYQLNIQFLDLQKKGEVHEHT